jgi:hypothetical protein
MAVAPPGDMLSRREQLAVVSIALIVLATVVLWASGVGLEVLLWFQDHVADLWSRDPAAWVSLIQTALAIVGGLWVFYLYRTSRTGQTTISITPNCWLSQTRVDDLRVLFVRVRVTNVSKAVCTGCQATITLMDASVRDPVTEQMTLPVFAEQNPWALLNEDVAGDSDSLLSLEPGETIDSEAAFFLRDQPLLAVRVAVSGDQGAIFRKPFEWNTAFFVDVKELKPQAFGLSPQAPPASA